MTRTRFSQWVVLACIGTLAACTSGEGGPTGNTELNVIIPNGSGNGSSQPGVIDVQSVEYTIVCQGGEQGGGFLEGGDGFTDAVTLNGNLEVQDGSVPPIAQGYMDIPPGDCLVQLRARDGDGEVVCTGDNRLADAADQNVDANEVQVVNIVLVCGNISFQAPVGMLDVRGDFSYFVGNFCPDLFVLNCLDSAPALPVDDLGDPTGVPAATSCEVRFRDNDGGCNEGCDPQFCQEDADGLLSCTPASPPEDQDGNSMAGIAVKTVVDCGGADMDCENDGIFGESTCTYEGNQLGSLPTNIPTQNVPNPADFGVDCSLAASGATITCQAYTTDGDRDCDKIKTVDILCPGDTPCTEFGGDAACQAAAGTSCVTSTCNNTTCDGVNAAACCDNVNVPDTTDCSAEIPPLSECVGGVCTPQACTADIDCDDSNACTEPQTCNVGTGLCEPDPAVNEPTGTLCQVIVPDDGVCEGGSCDLFVCANAGDCDDSNPCTDDTCDTGTAAGVCTNAPNGTNICTTCPGGAPCVCNGTTGTCDDAAPTPNLVCAQYSPVPVSTLQTCDASSPAETCICEKPEFLAVDCELLGNKAAIPLQAAIQQVGVAFAGTPVATVPQDAVVLPAALVCGFLGVGFAQATVANSAILAPFTNADLANTNLTSFVDDGTAGGALVSPHNPTIFQFSDACGDACVGAVGSQTCLSDGTIACTNSNFADVCPDTGTGPGLVVPFLANAPGTLPPGTAPVLITPTAAGTVDFDLPYNGLALNLPDVSGPGGTALGCIGGGPGCTLGPLCSDILRGSLLSPRIMYDANCNKLQFGGGLCSPFESFAQLGRICNGDGLEVDEFVAGDVPACCDDTANPFCTSAANVTSCCNALAADYPTASPAQNPQIPVN